MAVLDAQVPVTICWPQALAPDREAEGLPAVDDVARRGVEGPAGEDAFRGVVVRPVRGVVAPLDAGK